MSVKKQVFSLEIPGHATRREWAVYIIVATDNVNERHFYVGKVGDNRKGCNPIISRMGNHLSHNRIHSQFRNKIEDTSKYNYRCHYAFFGIYNENSHAEGRDKINELERRLNKLVKGKVTLSPNCRLENEYYGKSRISDSEKNKRASLVKLNEEEILAELVEAAFSE